MKKILAIILCLTAALALTACVGQPTIGGMLNATPEPTPEPTPEVTPAPTPERFPTLIWDAPIQWKDETLKKLIYDALGKDLSQPVAPQDLWQITHIKLISDREIQLSELPNLNMYLDDDGVIRGHKGSYTAADSVKMCLDDLRYFTNLRTLQVAFVEVEDIEFLGEMAHYRELKEVYMQGCGIEDVTPLGNFEKLISLNLNHNSITDLSPLGGMDSILHLYAHHNNVSDLSFMADVDVAALHMSHNNISDLSVFAYLDSLPEQIELQYNEISDISPLARNGRSQSGFAHISLRNNNISDISAFSDYTNVSILSLTNNNITDVSPLKNLNKMNDIYLVNNPVENWEELAGFYNLRK